MLSVTFDFRKNVFKKYRMAAVFAAGLLSFTAQQASAQNWDGAYFGIHGGWINSETELDVKNPSAFYEALLLFGDIVPTTLDNDADGFMGGIQTGFNKQYGKWVLGIEGDISWTDIDESSTVNMPGAFGMGFLPSTTTATTEMDWFATLRLRAGVLASPNFLVYATGGLAVADINQRVSLVLDPSFMGNLSGSDSDTTAGWTAGGGVEWALGSNWTVKAEYLYYDLGDTTVNLTDSLWPDDRLSYEHENTGHIARVGINYKFGARREVEPLK